MKNYNKSQTYYSASIFKTQCFGFLILNAYGFVADIFAQSFREILRRSFNVSIEISLYTQKLYIEGKNQIIIFSFKMFKSFRQLQHFCLPSRLAFC